MKQLDRSYADDAETGHSPGQKIPNQMLSWGVKGTATGKEQRSHSSTGQWVLICMQGLRLTQAQTSMSNTINPQRVLHQATLDQEGPRGSLLPQLTQLLVRTRSSTLHGDSFLYKAVPASTRSSGECCTSQSIGKCTTRAASKLLWTLTLRVWWH